MVNFIVQTHLSELNLYMTFIAIQILKIRFVRISAANNKIKSNQIKSILLVQNPVIGLSPVTYSTQIQIKSYREQYTVY